MKRNHSMQDGPAKLLKDIYATKDEIFCDDVSDLIIRCADALYSDREARELYPQLFQHFRFCPDCAAEYQINMELARLEAQGQLERPAVMPPLPPPPPLSPAEKELGLLEQVQTLFTYVFSDFVASSAMPARGAVRGSTAHALGTITSQDGQMQIRLQREKSRSLPGFYTLVCILTLSSTEPTPQVDQVTVQLEQADSGEVIDSKKLDNKGTAQFREVEPGMYQLRLLIGEQTHLIQQIDTEITKAHSTTALP